MSQVIVSIFILLIVSGVHQQAERDIRKRFPLTIPIKLPGHS